MDEDFAWHHFYSAGDDSKGPSQLDTRVYVTKDAGKSLGDQGHSDLLGWLWGKALGEWT